jgi:hypothetical protein
MFAANLSADRPDSTQDDEEPVLVVDGVFAAVFGAATAVDFLTVLLGFMVFA